MTKFDYETFISNTKISAYKAKAISDAFAREYIDSTNFHVTAVQIETNPDDYCYLFTAMHDVLCEVCERLDALEGFREETSA